MKKTYQEVVGDLKQIKNLKTKDVDKYNKKLIKERIDVRELRDYVKDDDLVHRTYFQVSMGLLSNYQEQLQFIQDNYLLLNDWWHVDQLTQFIHEDMDFKYVYALAKSYIKSEHLFLRRWGYVIFISGLQKNKQYTKKILKLIKDDKEYYVQMAQAWLICDLAVYNPEEVVKFLSNSKIKYNILGRAIQKMCDSFRISDEVKETVKGLRDKLKDN